MKKIIIGLVVAGILAVGWWLASPLFISKEVSENLEDIMPEQESAVEIASGSFTGLAGHSGEGAAKLLRIGSKHYIRLEEDFRVTNGPDLFVYLGKNGQYDSEARLASLKGNIGSQNYEIPESINPADYDEVWVWCRAFSVPFAKAVLQ